MDKNNIKSKRTLFIRFIKFNKKSGNGFSHIQRPKLYETYSTNRDFSCFRSLLLKASRRLPRPWERHQKSLQSRHQHSSWDIFRYKTIFCTFYNSSYIISQISNNLLNWYIFPFRPSTPFRPRRIPPSSSRCRSTSSLTSWTKATTTAQVVAGPANPPPAATGTREKMTNM